MQGLECGPPVSQAPCLLSAVLVTGPKRPKSCDQGGVGGLEDNGLCFLGLGLLPCPPQSSHSPPPSACPSQASVGLRQTCRLQGGEEGSSCSLRSQPVGSGWLLAAGPSSWLSHTHRVTSFLRAKGGARQMAWGGMLASPRPCWLLRL